MNSRLMIVPYYKEPNFLSFNGYNIAIYSKVKVEMSLLEGYIGDVEIQFDEKIRAIVPAQEFQRRIIENPLIRVCDNMVEIVFWYMEDNTLYEFTRIGLEGEWTLYGLGIAKKTDRDYTNFLKA